jgi:hypothetical protein
MKKIILLLLLASLCNSLPAQIRKIPAEVTDSFKARYPDAQQVEWRAKISDFEASFTLNGFATTAEFSSKGEWKDSEKKMNFDALPPTVKDGFKKSKYNDWKPGSVTFIEKKNKEPEYKIYAEKNSIVQKKFLFFNQQGQLLRDQPGI